MISGGYGDREHKSDILLFNTRSNKIDKVNQATFGFASRSGWTYLERDGFVLSLVKYKEKGSYKHGIIRIGTNPKSFEIVYDFRRYF